MPGTLRIVLGASIAWSCATGTIPERSPRHHDLDPVPAQQVVDGPDDAEVIMFVTMLQKTRADAGCRPIAWDARIAAVAGKHSADMAERAYFSHTNPDGRDPFDRLRDAGLPFRAAAENIAKVMSAPAVHDSWLASPGHRRNMLDCSFTHHGAGRSGAHWTHLFVQR